MPISKVLIIALCANVYSYTKKSPILFGNEVVTRSNVADWRRRNKLHVNIKIPLKLMKNLFADTQIRIGKPNGRIPIKGWLSVQLTEFCEFFLGISCVVASFFSSVARQIFEWNRRQKVNFLPVSLRNFNWICWLFRLDFFFQIWIFKYFVNEITWFNMDKNSTSNNIISRAIDFYSWTLSLSGKYCSI